MDFHDGIIHSLEINPLSCDAVAIVTAYPGDGSNKRARFQISFGGISFISFVADFAELKRNEFAGTIVSIRQDADMTTNIYLTGGMLVVRSSLREISAK